MHKALIGLILAATAMTPVAAQAAESGAQPSRQEAVERFRQVARERAERRESRSEQRSEQQAERRQARAERQAERREARTERRVAQPAPQQQRVARQARQEQRTHSRQRGAGTVVGWQGPRNRNTREDADRYDRLARENAWRHGTEEQRREVLRQEREQRGDRRGWRGDRDDRRDWRGDRRDRDRWNRDWRHDRRYDWNRYRYSNRNLFRMHRYYAPYRNHRYSRFSIGITLGQPFYSQRYWLSDPWQYRLPAAPYGTQWVRYYNDVLLVDTWSGEVLDVIYDFFW